MNHGEDRKTVALIHVNFSHDPREPFPAYFSANLLSCSYNPGFHWFIFTNRQEIPAHPSNVEFIPFSQEEIGRAHV